MEKQKCYIAGKIGNLPEAEYKSNFDTAKREVAALGYEPVCPTDLPHLHGRSWAEYMVEDLTAMLKCSHLYALSNWRSSPGARIEMENALAAGLHIIHQAKGPNLLPKYQREVLSHYSNGLTTKEISTKVGKCESRVEFYLREIRDAMKVQTTAQACCEAIRKGWIG